MVPSSLENKCHITININHENECLKNEENALQLCSPGHSRKQRAKSLALNPATFDIFTPKKGDVCSS